MDVRQHRSHVRLLLFQVREAAPRYRPQMEVRGKEVVVAFLHNVQTVLITMLTERQIFPMMVVVKIPLITMRAVQSSRKLRVVETVPRYHLEAGVGGKEVELSKEPPRHLRQSPARCWVNRNVFIFAIICGLAGKMIRLK